MDLPSQALPKSKRLAKRREFLHVYEAGRKMFSRYCVVFFSDNDLAHSRLGVTATKKLGGAVVRNRLKRWTRETYRRQREPLGLDARHFDYVVNVKPAAADASYVDYSVDLQRALQRAGAPDGKSR
ncbi:MAG: ribonuclease P protein component [Thermoanaerobaculia bacterium]